MELKHHRAGTGEPLLLIHGIGSRWQMWEPVLDRLEASHDVIAIDLPGFGASPMPPTGIPPGATSLTDLVQAFLSEIGVSEPHVAGNSLGGLIALELARRGSVRTATALSPAGFASPSERRVARASLWVGVRIARLAIGRADALIQRPGVRRVAFGQMFAHPERISGADAAASVRAMADAPWFDATLPTLRPMEFAAGDGLTSPGAGAISVPVTIAWGDRDRLLLPRQAQRAAVAIPGARIVSLRDCGHVPTYDDPDQVASVLLESAAASRATSA